MATPAQSDNQNPEFGGILEGAETSEIVSAESIQSLSDEKLFVETLSGGETAIHEWMRRFKSLRDEQIKNGTATTTEEAAQ